MMSKQVKRKKGRMKEEQRRKKEDEIRGNGGDE